MAAFDPFLPLRAYGLVSHLNAFNFVSPLKDARFCRIADEQMVGPQPTHLGPRSTAATVYGRSMVIIGAKHIPAAEWHITSLHE